MAKRPVRIMQRVRPLSQRPVALRGAVLNQPITAGQEYSAAVTRAFDEMAAATEREILQLFAHNPSPALNSDDGATLDAASLPNLLQTLINRLRKRFTLQFNELARFATDRMVDRTVENSQAQMRRSLKDIAPELTIKMDKIPQAMKDVINAGSKQAAGLIKTVPAKYLDQIAGDTMRSISTGMGLQDLIPQLEKQKVEKRNWARNVALDQTRKVYNTVNRERMKSLGIKRFEWIHSGGSQQPREYHKFTLNGNIYDIDNPPVIDQRTGERGYPGQLPYCRCTMRPVIEFEEES